MRTRTVRMRTVRDCAPCTLVPLAFIAACNGTTSYLDATGTAGRQEALLGRWLTGTACVVVALVCIAMLAAMARHRGERDKPSGHAERREVRSGLAWIYVGLGATVVVLLIAFGGTMVTLEAASHPRVAPTITLDVTGHQWWWEVRYADARDPSLGFVTANEIHLPVGVPVRVRLHSADVIHSFWLPQIAGKTDAIPGQTNETWLEARQEGKSLGPCTEYCGLEHAMMSIAVTAESPDAFAKWAALQRSDAPVPTTDAARRGAVVFARSCGSCHAVSGTNALGRLGPELTHVASRPTIGAGALDNNGSNLARWIRDPQRVKEGTRMPAMPLDDAELSAVVAYLQTLR